VARLTALLRYARRSDMNRAQATSTRAGAVLEIFVTLSLAILLIDLLRRSGFGPLEARTSIAYQLWAVLAALLLFLPLGGRSSLQPSILAIRPIGRSKIRCFHVMSIWASNRCLAAITLAVLSTLMALRLPHSLRNLLLACLCFSSAFLLSTGISMVINHLQQGYAYSSSKNLRSTSRPCPIFRKDLQAFRRLLDPWVTMILALLIGITEFLGSWIDTAGALLSAFTCAVLCMPLFLLPFGLDATAERSRQQLMPLGTSQLLLRKHGAAATLLFFTCLPLSIAILLRAGQQPAIAYVEALPATIIGLLIASVLMFRSPALLGVHLSVGVLAGNQLPVAQFVLGALFAGVPLVLVLFINALRTPFHHLLVLMLLIAMGVLYRVALRRVDHN